MTRVNLRELFDCQSLTPDQMDQISKTILPKLSEQTLEQLFLKIEWLVAFDRASNSPGPSFPLHMRLKKLSGQLQKCLTTIDEIRSEGTQLENLDVHYWQSNNGDESMKHLAEVLRLSHEDLIRSDDIEQVREYYSFSGTQEILARIQKTVSDWHRLIKPGSKRGRNLPSQHQNLILGLIEFFEERVPENIYKISASPGSKFETLIGFIFSDILETGTSSAKDHIAYVLDRSGYISKRAGRKSLRS